MPYPEYGRTRQINWMEDCVDAGGAEMQFVLNYRKGKARFGVPLHGFADAFAEALGLSGG